MGCNFATICCSIVKKRKKADLHNKCNVYDSTGPAGSSRIIFQNFYNKKAALLRTAFLTYIKLF